MSPEAYEMIDAGITFRISLMLIFSTKSAIIVLIHFNFFETLMNYKSSHLPEMLIKASPQHPASSQRMMTLNTLAVFDTIHKMRTKHACDSNLSWGLIRLQYQNFSIDNHNNKKIWGRLTFQFTKAA